MLLWEHEAAQLRSEVTINAGRQRRRHHVAVRGQPALAAKTYDVRTDHQVLHDKTRIPFEARAARRLHLDGLLFVDRKLRRFAAALRPPVAARSRLRLRRPLP